MASPRQRSARWAYEHAIADFSEASEVLYARAASGGPATPEELTRYANAKIRLAVARQFYEEAQWF
jgi:hypothetical protein